MSATELHRVAPGSAPRRRGWGWPLLIGGLLVGGAGANVGLMLVANSDPGFAVEPDYYQKALHWDETMAQEARNASLGWSVAVSFDRSSRPGQVMIAARVSDGGGRPVEGARVDIEAFHSARANRVLAATLAAGPGGRYAAALPLDRPGLWELRLRVAQGEQTFTQTIIQDLASAP